MAEENQELVIPDGLSLTDEERAILETTPPPGHRNAQWWADHPEEKIRQSVIARIQVAQGTFGGGAAGRKQVRPAYEIAAVHAAVNGTKLAKELVWQALNAPKISDRKAAIDLLFEMELKVRSEARDQEDHLLKLSGEELNIELFKVLRELTGATELDSYIDSDAVEIESDSEAA